jgi:hypothetical protein
VNDVVLEVSRIVQEDFRLAIAAGAESVEIAATAAVINTATTAVGTTVDQRTVQEIPLNGRHFVDLGLLTAGTIAPPASSYLGAPLRGQGSFAIISAGNREDATNFMINGINLNDMAQNQITFQPSINTVQEFSLDNSTYSAQYGRNSGAIVNIATRSGTNSYHGRFSITCATTISTPGIISIGWASHNPRSSGTISARMAGDLSGVTRHFSS